MAERIVGALFGLAVISLFIWGLWYFGHPYSAIFLIGAAFQHFCEFVYAALDIGPLRFSQSGPLR